MIIVKAINKIVMFLVMVIFTLAVIVIYNMAGTYYHSNFIYNYDPLPTVRPDSLPDTAMKGNIPKCLVTPTECNISGECDDCEGNGNVTCSDPTNDITYVLQSGVEIPNDGKSYCVPRAATNMPCNKYTGKYVWTDSAESGQEWKCECLYPDLFNDPGTGCTTQVACGNSKYTGPQHKLAELSSLKIGGTVKFWDPSDPNGANNQLRDNPYSTTVDGKPKYVCACGIEENDGKYQVDQQTVPPFLRLPADPYSCHVDPCDEIGGFVGGRAMVQVGGLPGCDADGVCDCKSGDSNFYCDGTNRFLVQLGRYKNKCYDTAAACQEVVDSRGISSGAMYKDTSPLCSCGDEASPRMCISDAVSLTDIQEKFPDGDWRRRVVKCKNDLDCVQGTCDGSSGVCRCQDPLNPIGSECVSVCYPRNPCQNNTKCNVAADSNNSAKGFTCDCDRTADDEVRFPGGKKEGGQNIFKVDGVQDCDGKDVHAYWGNSYDNQAGVCSEMVAVPNTQIYKNIRQCIMGNAQLPLPNTLCSIALNGITESNTSEFKDPPNKGSLRNIGAGFGCEEKINYEEGMCSSLLSKWWELGNGKVTTKATCGGDTE